MIAYIKGKILGKGSQFVIIENNGLGYKVFVTPNLLLKSVGEEITSFIYHKSSDDGQTLFGMEDLESLQFFEMLITVNGVGPKMALNMLSHATPKILQNAIASGDTAFFTQMSGVGKKTAERIILELSGKLSDSEIPANMSSNTYNALLSLGYSSSEARGAMQKVDQSAPESDQLKQALKQLSNR